MTTLQNTATQIGFGLQPIIDYSVPTVNGTYSLPTGSNIKAGQRVQIVNGGANSGNFPIISINASDGTLVRQVYPLTDGTVMALQDNPTNTAHWAGLGTVKSNVINQNSLINNTNGWSLRGSSNGVVWTNQTVTNAFMKRDGDTARFRAEIVFTGTPGGGVGAFGLVIPSVFQIDSTKMPVGNGPVVGTCTPVIGGPYTSCTFLGNLNFGSIGQANVYFSGSGNDVSATSPSTFANGSIITCDFSVPILGWSDTKG